MNSIKHRYQGIRMERCDKCGHKRAISTGIREYEIKGYDLSEIVEGLKKKHSINLECKICDIKCERLEKLGVKDRTPILVTEIDDMIEHFYPDISEIPEGVESNGFANNVWLDASLAVEKQLISDGFVIEH